MTPPDTVAVLKAAHKGGIPPIQFSVLAALVSFTNWRGRCHPGQRKLAEVCSINKDTVTMAVKWLADRQVIEIHTKRKSVNSYEVLARSKWKLSAPAGQVKKCNLSGSTAQFAVRSGRTGQIGLFRVNCPLPPDITKDSAQGAIGNASHLGRLDNEPSATDSTGKINGDHHLGFA